MKLIGMTEQEFTDKTRVVLKNKIKGLNNSELWIIYNNMLAKIKKKYQKKGAFILEQIDKNTVELVKEFIKELDLNKSDVHMALGIAEIKNIYSKKDINEFICDEDIRAIYSGTKDSRVQISVIEELLKNENILVIVLEMSAVIYGKDYLNTTGEGDARDLPSLLLIKLD